MRALAFLALLLTVPAIAQTASVDAKTGASLMVEILWADGVDLDLFLTDPEGETIYFANRKAKSGAVMGLEMGCDTVSKSQPLFKETAKIPTALQGRYRVSVDFIKDCGKSVIETPLTIRLVDEADKELGRGVAKVRYRVLEPVAWEFFVK